MKTNQAGLDLIKHFEGFGDKPYKDMGGVPTIGYGHTQGVKLGDSIITEQQAEQLLISDVGRFEGQIEDLLEVDVNENQFSALVCFVFNLGIGSLRRSTLLRCINKEDFSTAANKFLAWNRVGTRIVDGLTARRQAESELFQRPVT